MIKPVPGPFKEELNRHNEETRRTLDTLSDEELRKELELRSVKRKQKALLENNEYLGRIEKVLTIEVINALAPSHDRDPDRASCSDKDTCGGFGWTGTGNSPLCVRCALIEIMGGLGRTYTSPDSLVTLKLEVEVRKA